MWKKTMNDEDDAINDIGISSCTAALKPLTSKI